MKVPRYFTLEELLYSGTAIQKGISNAPSWMVIEHLNELALFLDGIREAWGSAIICNSGYRCKAVNDKLKGASKTSVHMIGFAIDMVPANGKIEQFAEFLRDYLKDKMFDQLIWEKSGRSRWLHLGLYSNRGEQRRMVFEMTV